MAAHVISTSRYTRTESAGESQRRKGMIKAEDGEEDREHRGGGRERERSDGRGRGERGGDKMGVKGTVE